jgi:hypothetical protein
LEWKRKTLIGIKDDENCRLNIQMTSGEGKKYYYQKNKNKSFTICTDDITSIRRPG